jgi:5'-nucleotidase
VRLFGVIVLVLAAAFAVSGGATAEEPGLVPAFTPDFTLTILHNNDTESRLINVGSGLEDYGGAGRFATLVKQLRHEAQNEFGRSGVLTLSSGNSLLAGAQFHASVVHGAPYYDAVAMGLIGYDAVALGHRDFDFGPEVLGNFIRSFAAAGLPAPPFVSANIDVTGEAALETLAQDQLIVKRTLVTTGGEQIGIVAVMTPRLAFISSSRNVTVDPALAQTVQAQIDALTQGGVNKIVLLSHLQSVTNDTTLAAQLSNVDVIISGGGGQLLANASDLLAPGDVRDPLRPYPMQAYGVDGQPVLIVTTAGEYKYVGRLILRFNAEGRVIYVDPRSGPVRVAGGLDADAVWQDADVYQRVVAPVTEFVSRLGSEVIAHSEVALDGRRAPGVRTQETNLGNLTADSLLWEAQTLAASFGAPAADVAIHNGGGITANRLIPTGPFSALDVFSVVGFPNFVSVVEGVSPAQLKEIIENAVSLVDRQDGRFLQVSGLWIVYDPNAQAQVVDNAGNVLVPGSRIWEVRLNDGTYIVRDGVVQDGAPALDIATINFLAGGGDQYPFRNLSFTTLGTSQQQALSAYITEGLGGRITAARYPEGGEGRITTR